MAGIVAARSIAIHRIVEIIVIVVLRRHEYPVPAGLNHVSQAKIDDLVCCHRLGTFWRQIGKLKRICATATKQGYLFDPYDDVIVATAADDGFEIRDIGHFDKVDAPFVLYTLVR